MGLAGLLGTLFERNLAPPLVECFLRLRSPADFSLTCLVGEKHAFEPP
jgi:hypothetical protein